jgi:hypothetical protein
MNSAGMPCGTVPPSYISAERREGRGEIENGGWLKGLIAANARVVSPSRALPRPSRPAAMKKG